MKNILTGFWTTFLELFWKKVEIHIFHLSRFALVPCAVYLVYTEMKFLIFLVLLYATSTSKPVTITVQTKNVSDWKTPFLKGNGVGRWIRILPLLESNTPTLMIFCRLDAGRPPPFPLIGLAAPVYPTILWIIKVRKPSYCSLRSSRKKTINVYRNQKSSLQFFEV